MMKILEWLVNSSADKSKLALTVKGAVTFGLSLAAFLSPVFGWKPNIGDPEIELLVQTIVETIVLTTSAISAVATLYGFLRKIYYSLKK